MFPFSSKLPSSVPRTEPETEKLEWSEMQLALHIFNFPVPQARLDPPESEAALWGPWLKCAIQAFVGNALKHPVFVSNVRLQDVGEREEGGRRLGAGTKPSSVFQSLGHPMPCFQDVILYSLLLMVYLGNISQTTGNKTICKI